MPAAEPGAPARPVSAAGPVRFAAHADEQAWSEAVCAAVLQAVQEERRSRGAPLLLLAGGESPAPAYRRLAEAWPSFHEPAARITVSLVDERWVEPGAAGSNEEMLRRTLLDRAGPGACFWPLADHAAGLAASVRLANARLAAAPNAPSLVLLGMGEDGHTASMFPGSPDLQSALASTVPYCAVDARGCAAAGPWARRITLTPAGWRFARKRLLVIRGERKRRVFEQALRERDAQTFPVCAAFAVGEAPLEVHWAPA
jgi:6-phosphogluconolactonase